MESNQDHALYDAIAPVYGEYSMGYENYLVSVEDKVISELSPGIRLLDIGSGDGRRLSRILNAVPGVSCVALEPSREMAEICKSSIAGEVHTVRVEELGVMDVGEFDIVTSLWNVFGHIPLNSRLSALRDIASKLSPGGKLILDVNNRHNASSYGRIKVLARRLLDVIDFREKRGDATYEWNVNGEVYKGHGHLFTPKEIESLFSKAGFVIQKRLTINYRSGQASTSKFSGQLFYVLLKS